MRQSSTGEGHAAGPPLHGRGHAAGPPQGWFPVLCKELGLSSPYLVQDPVRIQLCVGRDRDVDRTDVKDGACQI